MKIYGALLILIMGFAFITAQSGQSSSLTLEKGWNLIYGFGYPNQINSEHEKNIKAIYVLNPETKEYLRVYPDPEYEKLQALDDDILANTAFWVYSNKRIVTNYEPLEVVPISERMMFKGWNFLGSTLDIVDKDFETIKGDCEISRIYLWNSIIQDWVQLSLNDDMESNALYYGVAIKVNNNCTLGEGTGNGGLPTLP